MRKIQSVFILMSMVLIAGCGKDNPPTPVFSSVVFVNAAVTPVTAPASGLYLNDSLFSNGIVLYNTNTGYFGVTPGDHTFKIKQEALPPAQPVTIATDAQGTLGANEAYTLVAYDSLSAGNSIRVMKLRDDLTVPEVTHGKVRFWQLSPNYPTPVDVTYLRTTATPADSVTIPGISFPGASPVVANFQNFTLVPFGTYTIKVKMAGTQTVVTNITGVVVGRRKIYSHYLTGNAQGRPLAFGQVVHF